MLANTEMQVAPAILAGLKIARTFEVQSGFRRRRQVGRPAHEPWDALCKDSECLAAGVPPTHALLIRRKYRQVPIPTPGQLTALHLLDLLPPRPKCPRVPPETRLPRRAAGPNAV